jgi:hypothetical protein
VFGVGGVDMCETMPASGHSGKTEVHRFQGRLCDNRIRQRLRGRRAAGGRVRGGRVVIGEERQDREGGQRWLCKQTNRLWRALDLVACGRCCVNYTYGVSTGDALVHT